MAGRWAVSDALRFRVGLVPHDVGSQVPSVFLEGECDAPGHPEEVFWLETFRGTDAALRALDRPVLGVGVAGMRPASAGSPVPQVEPERPVRAGGRARTSRNTSTMFCTYRSSVGSDPRHPRQAPQCWQYRPLVPFPGSECFFLPLVANCHVEVLVVAADAERIQSPSCSQSGSPPHIVGPVVLSPQYGGAITNARVVRDPRRRRASPR